MNGVGESNTALPHARQRIRRSSPRIGTALRCKAEAFDCMQNRGWAIPSTSFAMRSF